MALAKTQTRECLACKSCRVNNTLSMLATILPFAQLPKLPSLYLIDTQSQSLYKNSHVISIIVRSCPPCATSNLITHGSLPRCTPALPYYPTSSAPLYILPEHRPPLGRTTPCAVRLSSSFLCAPDCSPGVQWPRAHASHARRSIIVEGIVKPPGRTTRSASSLVCAVGAIIWHVHCVAVAPCTSILGCVPQLLLVVRTVAVSLSADTRVPCLIWVERSEAATTTWRTTAALERRLVCARCGAVVAVLELAELVVEPADNAARRRTRPVARIGRFPR